MSAPVQHGCRACGHDTLAPHLRTAGDAGPEGLIPTTDRYGTALSDIVRCDACGHMQLARFPSADELAHAYAVAASDDYVGEEAGQRATAAIALERIERHVAPGRILDLGCWVGFLLAEARDRGWTGVGVEPSDFAAAYAQGTLGLDVHHGDILSAPIEAGTFDAVVMGDVIEHLVEPAAALERIATALRPGGVVYMALPDAGSRVARLMGTRWWSVIPTHVQYFTHQSMERLLRRSGFEPLWIGTAPKSFSAAYYLERLEGYSAPLSRGLTSIARAAGVADRMVAPDFRDRMGVIARHRV